MDRHTHFHFIQDSEVYPAANVSTGQAGCLVSALLIKKIWTFAFKLRLTMFRMFISGRKLQEEERMRVETKDDTRQDTGKMNIVHLLQSQEERRHHAFMYENLHYK